MGNMTYDYPALKVAHNNLVAAVEAYEANGKQLADAGQELIEGNNAEGVKSTMDAFNEKQNGVIKVMHGLVDQSAQALAMAKELHIANGGEE